MIFHGITELAFFTYIDNDALYVTHGDKEEK